MELCIFVHETFKKIKAWNFASYKKKDAKRHGFLLIKGIDHAKMHGSWPKKFHAFSCLY